MAQKKESLTQKEHKAQEAYFAGIKAMPRKTNKPIVVAMVGLVGSGKKSVAKVLAKFLSAAVVDGDGIRVQLRKQNERYEGARKIAENIMIEILKQGGNVILDSDYIDQKKRASLKEKLKNTDAKLLFIRTYADYDVMAGRTIKEEYPVNKDDFFGGAGLESIWKDSKTAGSAVKLREMWRRTPNHYRWENKVGGKWILKKLPFVVFASIDTTGDDWAKEVKKTAERISKF